MLWEFVFELVDVTPDDDCLLPIWLVIVEELEQIEQILSLHFVGFGSGGGELQINDDEGWRFEGH